MARKTIEEVNAELTDDFKSPEYIEAKATLGERLIRMADKELTELCAREALGEKVSFEEQLHARRYWFPEVVSKAGFGVAPHAIWSITGEDSSGNATNHKLKAVVTSCDIDDLEVIVEWLSRAEAMGLIRDEFKDNAIEGLEDRVDITGFLSFNYYFESGNLQANINFGPAPIYNPTVHIGHISNLREEHIRKLIDLYKLGPERLPVGL